MSAALQPMPLDQFLRWEERQAGKYEFDGFQPIAMVGVRAAHATIQSNLIVALGTRLRGQRCRVYGSDLKVQVAGSIRYPDAFVACIPLAPAATVHHEPVILFEILSDSTATNDLVVKNAEYRDTPSVRRYVVLQQEAAAATVFSHRDGRWAMDTLADGALLLPEIGTEIPLAEIYEGLSFEPAS